MNDSMDKAPHPPTDKKRRPWYLVALVGVVVTVLGVVWMASSRDGTGLDVLSRSVERAGAEQLVESPYVYDESAWNQFAFLDESLVVLSDTSLSIYNPEGQLVYTQGVHMSSPVLDVGGEYVLAYDIGGDNLYVLGQDGLVQQRQYETIFTADLSQDDYLSVTTSHSGYKAVVEVYDPDQQMIFTFNSAQRFVMDATVVAKGASLVVATLGEEHGHFITSLVYYDMTQTMPQMSQELDNVLVLDMESKGDLMHLVGDSAMYILEEDGTIAGHYDYQNRFLRGYDWGGDGFGVLLLNSYQSGNVGSLLVLDNSGQEVAHLQVGQEIVDIAVAGRYIGVLYQDRLVVYTPELVEYTSLSGTDYAQGLWMQPDGAVYIFARRMAQLLLP